MFQSHGKRRFFSSWVVVGFCLALLAAPAITRAANETVTITTQFGGAFDAWDFTNAAGTPTDGYTVRIAAFSQSQSEVLSLSYNRAWINNQMQVFGSNVTATEGGFPGSFNYDLANNNDFFKGKQAWLVYSDGATLTSADNFGIVSSSDSSYTIASANPWSTTLQGQFLRNSQGGVVGFGSVTSTDASTGTIRTAAAPATYLYWDADHPATGGTGTWSTTSTTWSTTSAGVSGAGPYAWGTTSGTTYYSGAGLTAYFGGTDGTVTVSGTVQAHNGLNFDPTTGNTYTLSSGTINLAGTSAAANTITVAAGDTAIIGSALTGTNGLVKDGDGIVRLDGNNSGLSGNITVNDGTLRANAANAISLSGTDRITVNNGGSLLISHNDSVSGNITLAGGTIAMTGSGITDSVGTLTLASNSVIDLGSASGARSLYFDASNGIAWTGALSIWNWNGTNFHGTSYGVGDRQIFFGNSASGLTQTQLNSISFYSDAGSSFIGNAFIRANGEIAAIPEPEVYATAVLLLLGLGFHFYRQKSRRPALS